MNDEGCQAGTHAAFNLYIAFVAFDLWGMQAINQYIYSILEILFQMSVSGRKLYILVYKFMVYI